MVALPASTGFALTVPRQSYFASQRSEGWDTPGSIPRSSKNLFGARCKSIFSRQADVFGAMSVNMKAPGHHSDPHVTYLSQLLDEIGSGIIQVPKLVLSDKCEPLAVFQQAQSIRLRRDRATR